MDRTEKLKLQKMTVAAVAIAAALTMTACGSDGGDTKESTSAKPTTTTSSAPTTTVELPTSAELNGKVAQALDESVPAADKVNLVQGAEQDPELINQVAA